MEALLLLCDYAQAINGKLYIIGGGWTVCSPRMPSMSLAIKVLIPWDQANVKHNLAVELQDADGHPVNAGDPPLPVRRQGDFEVGRPPGVKPGSDLDFIMAVSFFGLPLEPNTGYRWQLEIDGEPLARASFYTKEKG